jgi:hypothetical protein
MVTSNDIHLFYIADYNEYASAKEIYSLWFRKVPISLISSRGLPVQIVQVKERAAVTTLYNLHVVSTYDSDYSEGRYGHNFFAGGILVHNEKAQSTVDNGVKGPNGKCCNDMEIILSYPRHAVCYGTQTDKDAWDACVKAGGP